MFLFVCFLYNLFNMKADPIRRRTLTHDFPGRFLPGGGHTKLQVAVCQGLCKKKSSLDKWFVRLQVSSPIETANVASVLLTIVITEHFYLQSVTFFLKILIPCFEPCIRAPPCGDMRQCRQSWYSLSPGPPGKGLWPDTLLVLLTAFSCQMHYLFIHKQYFITAW